MPKLTSLGEFEILPWVKTVEKIRKLAADAFYDDASKKIRRKKSKLMILVSLPKDRVNLEHLAKRLIRLEQVLVVIELQSTMVQDTYRVLATKHKDWKVGQWWFQSFG